MEKTAERRLARITIQNEFFRPNTQTEMREIVFKMTLPGAKTAALGDMISWLPALNYVAEKYNYVFGHLIVPSFFNEIATNVLGKYPHWRVHNSIPERLQGGFPLREQHRFPANATGFHLVDLGFVYYAGINPAPEGYDEYLRLDLSDVEGPRIGQKYAVMTPCMEAITRTMLPSVFNGVCDYLNSLGILPVFLGKTDMANRKINVDERYNLTKGLNLLNTTTLLEAAKIMEGAEMVIGIDNGLLHLAAMTDATILYGFTIAGPSQRRIKRPYGQTYEMYGDRAQVPCLFCQERVRFFQDHSFTECIYKENEPACVRALNLESFKATIDLALREKHAGT